MYAIVFAILATTLGCSAPGPSGGPAAPSTAPSTPPRGLRIATSGDYAPFSDWPTAGVPKGFSIAVAQAFADDQDLEIEWVRFRWPELASDLTAGRFDLALSGITVRADRSEVGRFSLPLTTSGAVLLVPADSPIRAATDLDRPSRAIAVNAGGHLERVARRLFGAARIEAIPDNGSVVDRLALDRSAGGEGPPGVDAVLTDSLEAPLWRQASKRPLREIGPLTHDRKAAWLPPDRRALARRFDRWLLRAETAGRLDLLRRAHGLSDEQTARPPAALLAKMDERLSLMPAVARSKAVLGRPIEDPAREARVLAAAIGSVETAALRAGQTLPARSGIRALFRAQIEAAKWIQSRALETIPETASDAGTSAQEAATRRLEDVLRPALIDLGEQITLLVVASLAEGEPAPSYARVALALADHGLPEAQLRALHGALVETLGPPVAPATGATPDRPVTVGGPTPGAIGQSRLQSRGQ